MNPAYFPTAEAAQAAIEAYVDVTYPNKFQDAFSITRIKVIETSLGFAVQFGDYGPYLEQPTKE